MLNVFEIWRDHLLMLHARETVRPSCSLQIKFPTNSLQSLLLFKQIMDSLYLPVFQYIAAVDFVQQFVQTSSTKQFTLDFP